MALNRDELLKEAPDFVQTAEPGLQTYYIEYEIARRELDEFPERFFVFRDQEGELKRIDLKNVNIKGVILNAGGTEEDVKDALEIKKDRYYKIMRRYTEAKKRYWYAFDLYNDKSKALGSLTPYLLELFGKMHGIEDVKKIMRAQFGHVLSHEELVVFYNQNKAMIESRQAQFVLSSDKYRIASDAGRLEVLNELLIDFQLKYKLALEKDQNNQALQYSKEVRQILEQARKEIKGNELKLTVDGRIDITATLHGKENIAKVFREIPVNAIVIGLTAARSGMKPEVLVAQLASSYYADFNGFKKNILGSEKIELPGDLIKAYDWKEVEEKNKQFLHEMQPMETEYEDVTDQIEAANIKSDVLNRIKQLKNNTQSPN